MKTLTRSLITLFAPALLTFSAFGGPEPISRDYKESKEVVPAPPPPCNWTGFYLGVHGGGAFGESDATDIDPHHSGQPREWSYDVSGFVGGAQAGYNFQFGRFVFGVEGDAGYMHLDGERDQNPNDPVGIVGRTDSDFYATLRGRVGVTFDCWLLYVTAGGIGVNYDASIIGSGDDFGFGSRSDFRFGPTVGGGVEYAFNRHWSAKVEYLYFNLEGDSFTFHEATGADFRYDIETQGHIVRAGLNFRF